jgi:SAM-dependent methyltransferase
MDLKKHSKKNMAIKIIEHEDKKYPAFQSEGYAAQFAIPYAKKVCAGKGVDIGCHKPEWAFPNAHMVDPAINEFDALNFPYHNLDYVFSSHCLEHLNDWVDVLHYWTSKLKSGGVLFLYLPDYSQTYWRPWNNRKHKNIFNSQIIADVLANLNYENIFTSGVDLNNSFMAFGSKK